MLPVDDPRLLAMLVSYEAFLNKPLCSPEALFDAPFVVLAHGVEVPPILFYGNQVALKLWEQDFDRFTKMPSRETAEPDHREAREALLTEVERQGFSTGYRGIRVSRTGRRFEISHATVWNILDGTGCRLGQAAMFSEYRYL